MIKLLLTYLALHVLKGYDPKVTFWLTVTQNAILFAATLPVLLWAIDSARARKVGIEEFNALPLLSRFGGISILLFSLSAWFKDAAKHKEHQFLLPYIPEDKWLLIFATIFLGGMALTSFVTKRYRVWREKRARRPKKNETKAIEKTSPVSPSVTEVVPVFSVNFQSLKALSVSLSNLVFQDPTHYLVEYFKFVRFYVEKCDLEAVTDSVKLEAFDNEIQEFISLLRSGNEFPIVPTDVELLPHIPEPGVQFEYLLGPSGLEFVGNGPEAMQENPTEHLVISFYAVFETLSSSLKGGDKDAVRKYLGAEIEKVRTQSYFSAK